MKAVPTRVVNCSYNGAESTASRRSASAWSNYVDAQGCADQAIREDKPAYLIMKLQRIALELRNRAISIEAR